MKTEIFDKLAQALQERLKVIADHGFRDRDPVAHLKKLQEVSEEIECCVIVLLQEAIDPKLCHYLERRSYGKALAWMEEQARSSITE